VDRCAHDEPTVLENCRVALWLFSSRREAHLPLGSAQRRCVLPNVRANRRAAAGGAWPRKDNWRSGLERPGDDCRSVSG